MGATLILMVKRAEKEMREIRKPYYGVKTKNARREWRQKKKGETPPEWGGVKRARMPGQEKC